MVRDLELEEVIVLARSLTLKTVMAGIPIGGAKVGVCIKSNGYDRQHLLRLITKTIGRHIKNARYFPGTDIGFTEDDVDQIFARSGTKRRFFTGRVPVGEACAIGILTCLHYLNAAQHNLGNRTVALEGFGRLGLPTARLLSSKGFKILSISNIHGALHDPRGLDTEELALLSTLGPEKMFRAYQGSHLSATLGSSEAVNAVNADILIPGARTFTINEDVAENVKAKIVCPLSNSPVTANGEKSLAQKGIISVPDFISNAGGVIASFAQQLGANPNETRALISRILTRNLELVFQNVRSGEIPKSIACDLAMERLDKLSSHQLKGSFSLMAQWMRALGSKAIFHGFARYLSLSGG